MQTIRRGQRPSKKSTIVARWRQGARDIWSLAEEVGSKPSYVASVLQAAGILRNYYDLYTSPECPANIYFGFFEKKLGFRTLARAQASVELIDRVYRRLEELRDRAGQHHCMVTALAMLNRARFCGKAAEAEPFRAWLRSHLGSEPAVTIEERKVG